MKISLIRLAGGLFCAVLAANAALAKPSVTRGRRIVERNCAMCHSVGVRGESPNRSAPRFRDLSKRYPIEMLEEALAEGMLTGHPAMPQFRFTVPEIDDIIVYLSGIQTKQTVRLPRPTTPAAALSRVSTN